MPDDEVPPGRYDVVAAIVESLNDVIASLREEIRLLADNESHGRKRTYTGMAIVGLLILLSLAQLRANHAQGEDIQRVVSYIESCQNPEGECARRNAATLAEAVRSISASVFDSLTECVLKTVPDARTDAAIKACRDRYFP